MATRKPSHFDILGKIVERLMVWAEDDPPSPLFGGKWIPMELLEIEGQVQ